jgi:hypothetical protein
MAGSPTATIPGAIDVSHPGMTSPDLPGYCQGAKFSFELAYVPGNFVAITCETEGAIVLLYTTTATRTWRPRPARPARCMGRGAIDKIRACEPSARRAPPPGRDAPTSCRM